MHLWGSEIRGDELLQGRLHSRGHGKQREPRIPRSTAGAGAAAASARPASPDQGGPLGRARAEMDGRERRTAATTCGWCGGPITPRSRGPIPKWCSATCRHRAWAQARAAGSGLSAVAVMERRVEVRVPLTPTRRDWPGLLDERAHQLNDGRVYDRDLPGLARALEPVLQAYRRRAHITGAPDVH